MTTSLMLLLNLFRKGHSSNRQPTLPGSTLSSIDGRSVPLGMVAIPLLHSLSGSAGSADEILIALVGGLVLVLVLSFVLVGNKGKRQDKDEQPDNEGL
jgi:hypothetical protein